MINNSKKRMIAGLLRVLSRQTTESVLSRFDFQTRQQVLDLIEQGTDVYDADNGRLVQSFAEFLFFEPERAGDTQTKPESKSATNSRIPLRTTDHQSESAAVSGSAGIAFEQILNLDDQALDTLLRTAPPELTIAALTCSPQRFVHRVMAKLASHEAETVAEQISSAKQITIAELNETQRRFCKFTDELVNAGLIQVTLDESPEKT